MPKQQTLAETSMLDRIARAIAEADDNPDFASNQARYRRQAAAALRTLLRPSARMIDAAHEAVWFDDAWAISSRRDVQTAVRAMIEVVD